MEKTQGFINALLAVVVLLLVTVLVQQGLVPLAPERRIEAAVSFLGDFNMSCHNQFGKSDFGYLAYVTPQDTDGNGLPDRFDFDANRSGDPEFYVHTGDFNPREMFFESGDPDMMEVVTSVLFHQLDVLDGRINDKIARLLESDENGPYAAIAEEELNQLLEEESAISRQLDLLPFLAGTEDQMINCSDLGLEELYNF